MNSIRLALFLLLIVALSSRVNQALQDSNQTISVGNETKSLETSNARHAHGESNVGKSGEEQRATEGDDLWSMVASMNDGSLRQDYEETDGRRIKYDWNLNLDKLGRYRLSWRVNYPSNHITFNLDLELSRRSNFRFGSDLFALGFSRDGQFQSSEFCLVWFDLSHRIHLQDARTNSNNTIELIDESESVCRLLKSNVVESRGTDSSSTSRDSDSDGSQEGPLEDDGGTGAEGAEQETNPDRAEITFRRQLDICKPKSNRDYYRIDNGTTNLIWFALRGPVLALDGLDLNQFGLTKKTGNAHHAQTESQRHDFEFGLNRVQLIASKPREKRARHAGGETAETSHSLDILMDNYHVPSKETTYWCKLFKLPERFESRRYHITSYEAAIKSGNEHVVHHMELFNCATRETRDLASLYSNGGWSGECSSPERPRVTESCRRVILAWAMGARPLIYPEQVGQSIGGQTYNPYVVLEVHYNNVERASGLVDSSGLRFHYTARLRQYDAGVLEVGLEYTDKNSIPPRMLTPLAGHCVGECTRVAMASAPETAAANQRRGRSHRRPHRLHSSSNNNTDGDRDESPEQPPRGIHIFAAQMHTHLTGVASWTEQVRAGRLVREIQRDDHYSPHFQEIRLLPEPVHVQPGDSLVHYCLYDTSKRANITLGGFATNDEMCVTYMHYYPKVDLEVCKSSVDSGALADYFAYLAREEGQRQLAENKSISEKYRAIDWTPRRSRELIEFYSNAPLSVQCLKSDGQAWAGAWDGIDAARIWPPEGESDRALSDWPPRSGRPLQGGARRLIEYRGRGAGRRHEQCLRGR